MPGDAVAFRRGTLMPHNFWMINSNPPNFNVTRRLGFTAQGLKAEYRRKVQRVAPGDRIIYYLTGIRAFAATATVTASYTERDAAAGPWQPEGRTGWPYRIGIKPDVVLDATQYIPAGLLAYRLEYIRKWPPEDWPLAFQGNLHLLSKNDFFMLEGEMLKLRDGREKALVEIERRLAEESEKQTAQRERRRAANRPPPPESQDGGTPDAAPSAKPAATTAAQRRPAAANRPQGNAKSPATPSASGPPKRGDASRRNARNRRRRSSDSNPPAPAS